ncbi:MAG: ribosomal protein S18-alanine N-acetyltransferase [Thermodesulfobacteriota bacterium]|nr:ribosomal protein S18-alanine N-acetyltransferase [Thermodesulfobacteriota bacterium]
MQIRQMNVGDVAAVAAIEAGCFSPWNKEQITAELERLAGLALVAVTSAGVVQGWCCGLLAGVDADLLKVAVSISRQRQGIATDLLKELCCRLAVRGGEQIFLEVRSQNIPALKLYAKLGWHETGRRKNYYKEPADDAVILVCRLNKEKE